MKLGLHNPWGGPNHRANVPQCKYLSVDRASQKGISSTHFITGRGGTKTTSGLLLAGDTAFITHPGQRGFWSEPRHEALFRVFLAEWEKIYDHQRHLWKFNQGRMRIECTNGSIIDLVNRNVDNPRKMVGHGPNYSWGINDEMADKFSMRTWNDLKASVRVESAPFRFMDSLSTPYPNAEYRALCMQKDATVIHATSYDNPFISKESVDDMAKDMSPEYAAVMIQGQWHTFEGRIWSNFVNDQWPLGNIHWAEWDDRKEWYLGVDLGQGLGHWQIWQYHDPVDSHGNRVFNGRLAVAVAEGVQQNESISPVLNRLKNDYGLKRNPVKIGIGHDVNTEGSTGPAPARLLSNMGWPFNWPKGEAAQKSIQHQVMDRLILNTEGERRFCISRNIKRHGPDSDGWGILNCMLTDSFPEPGRKEWFRKDKAQAGIMNCEDARDSMLYLAVENHPPSWAVFDRQAA